MHRETPASAQFETHSEAETAALAARLANVLDSGSVVALVGELGAGKTRLVQGIAEALGVDRRSVSSPTFVLIHEYEGRVPVYHFDAYRTKEAFEFTDLGAEELLDGNGVCLIEWADRVAELLPNDHLRIDIAATGETSRRFRMTATGPRAAGILSRLRTETT